MDVETFVEDDLSQWLRRVGVHVDHHETRTGALGRLIASPSRQLYRVWVLAVVLKILVIHQTLRRGVIGSILADRQEPEHVGLEMRHRQRRSGTPARRRTTNQGL